MTQLINRNSSGVYIIAATPFKENGSVDLDSTDHMIEFYLEKGVDGITILGVMGEAPKLTESESQEFADRVIARVNGRVPVVVGVTNPGIDAMRRFSQSVMQSGAAGVMIAPIPGLLTELKQCNYFQQVCEMLGPNIPICLQDYPVANGVQFGVETILKLTTELSQIVMFKHEDWPGLNKLTRVRQESGVNEIPPMSIVVGNAGLFLPQELQRGADGAMTGFAYPEMLRQVVDLHKAGEIDRSEDLFDAYLPMVRYEQQFGIGLAIRKEILHRRGVLKNAKVRAPGPSLTSEDHAELTRLMSRLEQKTKALA